MPSARVGLWHSLAEEMHHPTEDGDAHERPKHFWIVKMQQHFSVVPFGTGFPVKDRWPASRGWRPVPARRKLRLSSPGESLSPSFFLESRSRAKFDSTFPFPERGRLYLRLVGRCL